jgi:hypothetical protein
MLAEIAKVMAIMKIAIAPTTPPPITEMGGEQRHIMSEPCHSLQ